MQSIRPPSSSGQRWRHFAADRPRDCKLHEGQRGACFVRMRQGEQMILTTYGRSSDCGAAVAGRFAAQAGNFGRKRVPVTINLTS